MNGSKPIGEKMKGTAKKVVLLLALVSASMAHADFNKGYACLQSGDYSCAEKELRLAADQGHEESQYFLAALYASDKLGKRDYAEAAKLLHLAADQGHEKAPYGLGLAYENGDGVPQSKKTAKEWYRKACDNGAQSGCKRYRKLNKAGY